MTKETNNGNLVQSINLTASDSDCKRRRLPDTGQLKALMGGNYLTSESSAVSISHLT
jgi:phage/plasmid-associated DNA primase